MTALAAVALTFLAVVAAPSAAPSAAPRRRVESAAALAPRRGPPLQGAAAGRPGRGRRHDPTATMAQALELAARSLRAGASVLTALDAVAAELPASGFAEVTAHVRGGSSLRYGLDSWAGTRPERQSTAALLVLGHDSGAAMAASLDRAAASLRQRRALSDEVRALTAQTRASGTVVALAPAGFAVIVATVDPAALRVLISTPVGLVSLAAGVILEVLGVWWMRRLSVGVEVWS